MTTAAVIGSGFGGLALAVRLQSAGIRTVLFEKRDKPGGRAYVFEDQGFVFDAGPTVITDPACLEELFALSGRKLSDYVDLISVDPFYRLVWEDGRSFDYVNDQAGLDAEIARFSPEDVAGYRRFLRYSEAVYREGYVKLGAEAFQTFGSMIRVAPQLAGLESWRSVYDVVGRYIKDPQLRQAFSFHTLLVGGDPFKTSAIYALIHALERRGGVWFPRGGTGALVRGLTRLFEELGGEIRLNTPVERLETENGRVTAVHAGGERLAVDLVGSNADVVHTYADLMRADSRGRERGEQLKRKRFSMSLFVVYFGLNSQRPDLRHHTICFGRRYRELIRDIFKGPDLPQDFSLYLHAPCASDPGMAPEGCSTYYALSPVPHLGAADIDWEVEGPRYRDRILDYLEQRYIPNLRRDLVTVSHVTPTYFRDELNSWLGSAFSLEPILTQSAWFRTHNRDDEIDNLYFVGAGTHPGAGVPGVVGSAKATARLVMADLEARAAA